MNDAQGEVAHAQLSDEPAKTRYEELCLSIPEHGKRCREHAHTLMAEMWTMAAEVHELKTVCKALNKSYEAEAIKLCGGETAFHYLRDLFTAFGGDRQKALECTKAPYTLLREFRAERASRNRERKMGREKMRCPKRSRRRLTIVPADSNTTDVSAVPDMATPDNENVTGMAVERTSKCNEVLSQTDIGARNGFIETVGSWDRAVYVLLHSGANANKDQIRDGISAALKAARRILDWAEIHEEIIALKAAENGSEAITV